AEALGMQPGNHRPVVLAEELPKRSAEWAALVERHGLRAPRDIVEFVGYNSLVYADVMLGAVPAAEVAPLNSTIAIRQAGFHDCIDTEDMFCEMLRSLQQDGVIPPTG